jgi:TPR repeat protein
MHLQGEGVPVDRGQAACWLMQAAQAGDKEAKQLLRQHPDLAAAAASKP